MRRSLPWLYAAFLLITFIALQENAFAQNLSFPKYDEITSIEVSIKDKKLLLENQNRLIQLKDAARKEKDDAFQARCYANLIKIADLRTEDSLYFRNSAFLDTLIQSRTSSSGFKAIAYLLRAQRLVKFDMQYRKFNAATNSTAVKMVDYATLNKTDRRTLALADLDSAFAAKDINFNGNDLVWLSSNSDVFLFSPTFKDIVLSERLNLMAISDVFTNGQRLTHRFPQEINAWIVAPSKVFQDNLDSLAHNGKEINQVLLTYRKWFLANKSNTGKSLFIESLCRKYLYVHLNQDTTLENKYATYLERCRQTNYPELKAHAIYQLCLKWSQLGNQYFNVNDYASYKVLTSVEPKYQYYPVKVLQLYEQEKALFQKYPVFDKILAIIKNDIENKVVRLELEEKFIPEREIPFKVFYRNADTLYYRIIQTHMNEHSITKEKLWYVPIVKEGAFNLPLPADGNKHATYLKLSALPIGHYLLQFSYKPLSAENADVFSAPLQITQLAAINADERIFILDRKSGFPISGAKIKAFQNNREVLFVKEPKLDSAGSFLLNKVQYKSFSVNKNGQILKNKGAIDSLLICLNQDSLGYRIHTSQDYSLSDDYYDKEEYDGDKMEYYEDQLKMEIFTDRSIYRPGQKVQFKVIFLTKNGQTGETMLFTKHNVGNIIFNNRLKKWLKAGNDVLSLLNPFNKMVDSIDIKINEFGSFSGTFLLPKTAATGEWRIEGEVETSYANNGTFRLEEYKRPSIDLSLEKPKKTLFPGQDFDLKFRFRSFSGVNLANRKLIVEIKRSGSLPDEKGFPRNYLSVNIPTQTVYTNDSGEATLTIKDDVLKTYVLSDSLSWGFYYSIEAVAMDDSGESVRLSDQVNVSSRPIQINYDLAKVYDKQKIPALKIHTSTVLQGKIDTKVQMKLYRVNYYNGTEESRHEVDQWFYSKQDWNRWFPEKAVLATLKETKKLIFDTLVNTANGGLFNLPKSVLSTGVYELVATVTEHDKTIGRTASLFNVFDSQSKELPEEDIDYLPVTALQKGETVKWITSSKTDKNVIYQILYVDNNGVTKVVNDYQVKFEKAGYNEWNYTVPAYGVERLVIYRTFIQNNELFTTQKTIYILVPPKDELEIIVEKYRKILAPGASATFELSVKTKNTNIAAELMTSMYDASLDKLEPHKWNLPNTAVPVPYLYANWLNNLTRTNNLGNRFFVARSFSSDEDRYESTLGEGIALDDASGLQDVVLGYGINLRSTLTGAVASISIRGNNSLQDYAQPLIILNGEIYTGGLSSLDASAISQVMVLKGADASALYGSRAASGVLLISTNGPIVLPGMQDPVVKIRENFNETAFFYPQIQADRRGYFRFTFTIPESATEWNWMMFAHSKSAKFALLERKIQTQLNLMVQPNMPRLLYQGDQIKLQSRISNLDTVLVKGNASCKIEDGVTGADITALLLENNRQEFSIQKKSSGAVFFNLRVPQGQLNPLKIVITARTGSIADAEEHIIPVLSAKVLVKQNQPIQLSSSENQTISSASLPTDAQLYGAALSMPQKAQASLVYALPWLANYSFNCSEQTFNKLKANALSLKLMKTDTLAQQAFKNIQTSNLQAETETNAMPDEWAKETMPWLKLNESTAKKQHELYMLLDTIQTKANITKYLSRLYKLQQENGGLAWFDGGESNSYITSYVLAGFGQLKRMGYQVEASQKEQQKGFINRLYSYQVAHLNSATQNNLDNLFSCYALSYWSAEYPISAALNADILTVLKKAGGSLNEMSIGYQALFCTSALRLTPSESPLHQQAYALLKDLRQLAIEDDTHGIRWKAISNEEEMDRAAEENMAFISEAFEESGQYGDIQKGLVKWLLTAKENENWQTTKATAAAIDMLQKVEGTVVAKNNEVMATIADNKLRVSDGLLEGVPLQFIPTEQKPATITLQGKGKDVQGNLTWYYFIETTNLENFNKAVKLKRELYVYVEGKDWTLLQPNSLIKNGDRLRMKITIESSKPLKFVHLSEPRAAAFEPAESNSGYQFGQNLRYYQSVRDTGLDIFFEDIPRGISELTYELIAAHEGVFRYGPSKLSCMYQPAVTAYSNSFIVQTK
ncbi:MG2 domain-containing protein [Pedobacter sp. MW01-1-1]|uniref:alpha-2-macroglobulin family protein n=1 Tax=Pedobacter sp. MW01-1-1 TaxID=3383027 RepID=UPI003FF06BC1